MIFLPIENVGRKIKKNATQMMIFLPIENVGRKIKKTQNRWWFSSPLKMWVGK